MAYERNGMVEDGYPDLDILVAITSFGSREDCGTSDLPGVYTRVASYADWIKGKTMVSKVSVTNQISHLICGCIKVFWGVHSQCGV